MRERDTEKKWINKKKEKEKVWSEIEKQRRKVDSISSFSSLMIYQIIFGKFSLM